MDQVKIGKFIASLRRKAGLTQEALGEKLGVTNKTVSRWETGNYMPDIEMLQLLAQEFHVTVDELLTGKTQPAEADRQEAERNTLKMPDTGSFSFEERKAYFKRKWRREHIPLFAALFLIFSASIVLPIVFGKPYYAGLAPLIACIEYGYQNNKMMIYVENNLYSS